MLKITDGFIKAEQDYKAEANALKENLSISVGMEAIVMDHVFAEYVEKCKKLKSLEILNNTVKFR